MSSGNVSSQGLAGGTPVLRVAPLPTIRRMASYLRVLRLARGEGQESISATQIAEELRLESIQVRKDLAYTGITGKPGVGFLVEELIGKIESFLNWDNNTDAVLVGAGHLGGALLGFDAFRRYGLSIVAAFDADPTKVGTQIHGKHVLSMEKLANLIQRMHIRMAILTVTADAAQSVADQLVAAGIEGIWNFVPVTLKVPDQVFVQNEDLFSGLAVLSVMLQHNRKKGDPQHPEAEADG